MGIILILSAASTEARVVSWEKGFVEVRPGHELYVEHRKAEAGKPTLFLANGLTWSTRDWGLFVTALDKHDPGYGIVLFDMKGMGKTLLLHPHERETILIEDQVKDLRALKDKLAINGPQSLAGLSYGGGVSLLYMSKYPRDFDKVIAMAPLLERLTDQDQIIESWINSHRILYPLDPRTQEELYNHYLRVLIYTTYPLAEPVLLENPYKLEATYRMVQGAADFKAIELADRLPKAALHLMGALDDDFVKEPRMALFWKAIRKIGASYLRIHHTEHKIPSERPELAASWVHQILTENRNISGGRVFEADPFTAEARSGDIVIGLGTSGLCESLLRSAFQTF